jgi:peptide deformylase
MAVRQIIQLGHPALKAKNQKIVDFSDPKLTQLTDDLTDTMRKAGLIGIAAPQIAENFMVFLTEPKKTEFRGQDQTDELRIYVNPKIVWESEEKITIWEGCGSVTEVGIFGPVERSKKIEVEAHDARGRKFRLKADGILGRVIQHEMDHCLGIEFIEKVSDLTQLISTEFYIREIKNSPEQLKAQKITCRDIRFL